MTNNRGMTITQARQMASDPSTSPGVLSRLANGYPEVWDDLLANPAISDDLRNWITVAKQPQQSVKPAVMLDKKPQINVTTKRRLRGKRKSNRFLRFLITLLVPAAIIYGLQTGVHELAKNQPIKAIIASEELTEIVDNPAWKLNLGVEGEEGCATFETASVDQDLMAILVQNDIENKDCKESENPVASTLSLVDLNDGNVLWKVDLASELDWTEKWSKHLVEIPGLNEILVKYVNVNGGDVGGDSKTVDDNDNRKMKTIVPYNRLNGLITDPAIAKSKAQPIMQSPVLEIFPIPGNLRNVLVMTNGAKKNFRYANYRTKRFNSSKWSFESDLKPLGGNPIVAQRLILGRDEGDEPIGLNIRTGKSSAWNGDSHVKIYRFENRYIQVEGDGVRETATNVASQGGPKGHDIKISGITSTGEKLWTIEAKGYAISRGDSISKPKSRTWQKDLFVTSGKYNNSVSLVNLSDGSLKWTVKVPEKRFEISRISAPNNVSVYIFKDRDKDAKLLKFFNLSDGSISEGTKISGKEVRIDGVTQNVSVLIDEPSRTKLIEDLEDGKTPSVKSENATEDKIRTCAKGIENSKLDVLWSLDCHSNEHVTRVGGRWLVLHLESGKEALWPIGRVNNG